MENLKKYMSDDMRRKYEEFLEQEWDVFNHFFSPLLDLLTVTANWKTEMVESIWRDLHITLAITWLEVNVSGHAASRLEEELREFGREPTKGRRRMLVDRLHAMRVVSWSKVASQPITHGQARQFRAARYGILGRSDAVYTEPMTLTEIGEWFGKHRNSVRDKVLSVVRHNTIGNGNASRHQIDLRDMPPRYHEKCKR